VRWLTLRERRENTFVTITKKYYLIYVADELRLFEISMVARTMPMVVTGHERMKLT
jgi:hypothetical protein